MAVSRAPDPDLAGPELRYARRLDRSAQLALAAARQAIAEARLILTDDLIREALKEDKKARQEAKKQRRKEPETGEDETD